MAVIVILLVGGVVGVIATHVVDRRTAPKQSTPPNNQPAPTGTLRLESTAPASGSTNVEGATPVVLVFSSPLSPSSPLPTLSPPTAGTWSRAESTLTFTPTTGFIPLGAVTVTVPAGPAGVTSSVGGRLANPITEEFRIANGSTLRLQQLLSLLDYSPLAWTPIGSAISPVDSRAELLALFNPPGGAFTWRDHGWPRRLRAMWRTGVDNVFTRGLIMSFQADHGLDPDGAVTSSLWSALLESVETNDTNTGGYNYALANKAAPESLTIYHDGAVALRSPANTGIAASPTPDGTFPVNTRLRRQVMRGTNPDGRKYADLVQYIAYFHGNDAVHYMDRDDYGIPQSLGCVELPLADAAKAWPYLAYGTLVTVIN